jgi:hypothetical protein
MFVLIFSLYVTKNTYFLKCQKIWDWVIFLIYLCQSVNGRLPVWLPCPVNPCPSLHSTVTPQLLPSKANSVRFS